MKPENLLKSITTAFEKYLSAGEYDELFNQMYPSIKKLASYELSKLNPGQQLSPTLLVNECYLKLKLKDSFSFKNQKHFYHTVSKCMRYFLIDTVRQHYRLKRKGIQTVLEFSQVAGDKDIALDLLILDDVLDQLEQIDPDLAQITQFKFFSGMTFEEIAALYECSAAHIYNQWNVARALLVNLLEDHDQHEQG